MANQSITTSLFSALCASMNVLNSASEPIDLYVEAKRAEAAERRASSSAEGREREASMTSRRCAKHCLPPGKDLQGSSQNLFEFEGNLLRPFPILKVCFSVVNRTFPARKVEKFNCAAGAGHVSLPKCFRRPCQLPHSAFVQSFES